MRFGTARIDLSTGDLRQLYAQLYSTRASWPSGQPKNAGGGAGGGGCNAASTEGRLAPPAPRAL